MDKKGASLPPQEGTAAEHGVFERIWNGGSNVGQESPLLVTPVGRRNNLRQVEGNLPDSPCSEPKSSCVTYDLATKKYEMLPARGSMAISPQRCEELLGERALRGALFGKDHRIKEEQLATERKLTAVETETSTVIMEPSQMDTKLESRKEWERDNGTGEGSHCIDDFPLPTMVPCLGSGGPSFDGFLQEMIRKELSDWNYYRTLGRRTGGSAAKILSGMAAEEWKCAKRLCATYFLISGIHFWPEQTGKLHFPSFMGALRQRFLEEQQDAELYSAVALECQDACLRQIFEEIAGIDRQHATTIRLLVEQL